MLDLDRRMSFEVELNRVAVAVAQLLARQMDDTVLWLIHEDATPRDGPQQRTAEVANRIVVLCRRLVDDIHRYESWNRIRRDHEQQETTDDDLPF